MMKKVRKLTSATLKRIIAEERLKIKREQLAEGKKPRAKSSNSRLIAEIKKLIMLKKAQKQKIAEFKKIHEARKAIKSKLIKRL